MPSHSRQLPLALYTAAQVRELDRRAIDTFGIPGAHLMQRAGRAAFRALLRRWPAVAALHVLCGTGNNGGDGFVIASLAQARGLPVTVWQVGDAGRIGGDALAARELAVAAGVRTQPFESALFKEATADTGASPAVVVDALLGTGLGGPARPSFAAAIAAINDAGLPVLAADVPSGLCSDTGSVSGEAVVATLTISFIGLKRGLITGAGPTCCGDLLFDDLAVPLDVYVGTEPSARRLLLRRERGALGRRPRDAHKGHYGHVLVVGGDRGMLGAVLMASEAAARMGAGLVSCATRPEHAPLLALHRPEVMAHGVRSGQELDRLLDRATVVAIGPGLGRDAWSGQLLARAVTSDLPLVLDADALNLLAEGTVETPLHAGRQPRWILTPHPGEAARLLGVDAATVQRDRFAAAVELQRRFGGVVILKGVGTIVVDEREITVSSYGNPGMASGGMGDVLTGVVAGLLAQGLAAGAAARLAVCLHGAAADVAAADGERGLLATDLAPCLRRLVNGEGDEQ